MVTLARNRYRPSRRYQAPVDPRSLDLHAVPPVLEDSLGLHGPAGTSPGEQGLFGPRDDIQKVAGVPADPFAPRQRRSTSTFADRWEKSTSKAILQSVLDAVTLPGDVYRGEVDMMRPTMFQSITQTYDGKPIIRESATSDEAIGRAFDLAGTLTLGTGAVPAGANEMRMGIKAFHGSPHSFDKFSSERIGTGEAGFSPDIPAEQRAGRGAYGHGLYFAEREGVARDYRDNLTQPKLRYMEGDRTLEGAEENAAKLLAGFNSKDEAIDYLNTQVRGVALADPAWLDATERAMRELEPSKIKTRQEKSFGSMYEVDIAANPEDFLDWDKPLSEQSAQAQSALEKIYGEGLSGLHSEQLAGPVEQLLQSAGHLDRAEAAKVLRQAGIPGIRYLDQGSRVDPLKLTNMKRDLEIAKLGAELGDDPAALERLAKAEAAMASVEQGTRNYVVFDDSLISILKKYGVVGPVLAALGLSQALPDRAEAAEQSNGW